MSTTNIPLSAHFPFENPAYWDIYKAQFNRYCTVAKLTEAEDNTGVKVDCMLYAMGPKAEEIFGSFTFDTENDKKKFATVIAKFDNYFQGKTNVIFQRALFNRRVQQQGESIDDFITDLHKLVKYCNYGTFREEAIRDRLVVGVRDIRLSEKMQLVDDLNYTKALEMARNFVSVQKQNQVVYQQDISVAGIANRLIAKKKNTIKEPGWKSTANKQWKSYRCRSWKKHGQESCPAIEALCNKSKKTGHFAKVCMSKTEDTASNTKQIKTNKSAKIQAVEEDDSKHYYIRNVGTKELQKKWEETIQVNGIPIKFKLDCGADITVISLQCYNRLLKDSVRLQKQDRKLFGPTRQLLNTK
jgi:hypothetical protein